MLTMSHSHHDEDDKSHWKARINGANVMKGPPSGGAVHLTAFLRNQKAEEKTPRLPFAHRQLQIESLRIG